MSFFNIEIDLNCSIDFLSTIASEEAQSFFTKFNIPINGNGVYNIITEGNANSYCILRAIRQELDDENIYKHIVNRDCNLRLEGNIRMFTSIFSLMRTIYDRNTTKKSFPYNLDSRIQLTDSIINSTINNKINYNNSYTYINTYTSSVYSVWSTLHIKRDIVYVIGNLLDAVKSSGDMSSENFTTTTTAAIISLICEVLDNSIIPTELLYKKTFKAQELMVIIQKLFVTRIKRNILVGNYHTYQFRYNQRIVPDGNIPKLSLSYNYSSFCNIVNLYKSYADAMIDSTDLFIFISNELLRLIRENKDKGLYKCLNSSLLSIMRNYLGIDQRYTSSYDLITTLENLITNLSILPHAQVDYVLCKKKLFILNFFSNSCHVEVEGEDELGTMSMLDIIKYIYVCYTYTGRYNKKKVFFKCRHVNGPLEDLFIERSSKNLKMIKIIDEKINAIKKILYTYTLHSRANCMLPQGTHYDLRVPLIYIRVRQTIKPFIDRPSKQISILSLDGNNDSTQVLYSFYPILHINRGTFPSMEIHPDYYTDTSTTYEILRKLFNNIPSELMFMFRPFGTSVHKSNQYIIAKKFRNNHNDKYIVRMLKYIVEYYNIHNEIPKNVVVARIHTSQTSELITFIRVIPSYGLNITNNIHNITDIYLSSIDELTDLEEHMCTFEISETTVELSTFQKKYMKLKDDLLLYKIVDTPADNYLCGVYAIDICLRSMGFKVSFNSMKEYCENFEKNYFNFATLMGLAEALGLTLIHYSHLMHNSIIPDYTEIDNCIVIYSDPIELDGEIINHYQAMIPKKRSLREFIEIDFLGSIHNNLETFLESNFGGISEIYQGMTIGKNLASSNFDNIKGLDLILSRLLLSKMKPKSLTIKDITTIDQVEKKSVSVSRCKHGKYSCNNCQWMDGSTNKSKNLNILTFPCEIFETILTFCSYKDKWELIKTCNLLYTQYRIILIEERILEYSYKLAIPPRAPICISDQYMLLILQEHFIRNFRNFSQEVMEENIYEFCNQSERILLDDATLSDTSYETHIKNKYRSSALGMGRSRLERFDIVDIRHPDKFYPLKYDEEVTASTYHTCPYAELADDRGKEGYAMKVCNFIINQANNLYKDLRNKIIKLQEMIDMGIHHVNYSYISVRNITYYKGIELEIHNILRKIVSLDSCLLMHKGYMKFNITLTGDLCVYIRKTFISSVAISDSVYLYLNEKNEKKRKNMITLYYDTASINNVISIVDQFKSPTSQEQYQKELPTTLHDNSLSDDTKQVLESHETTCLVEFIEDKRIRQMIVNRDITKAIKLNGMVDPYQVINMSNEFLVKIRCPHGSSMISISKCIYCMTGWSWGDIISHGMEIGCWNPNTERPNNELRYHEGDTDIRIPGEMTIAAYNLDESIINLMKTSLEDPIEDVCVSDYESTTEPTINKLSDMDEDDYYPDNDLILPVINESIKDEVIAQDLIKDGKEVTYINNVVTVSDVIEEEEEVATIKEKLLLSDDDYDEEEVNELLNTAAEGLVREEDGLDNTIFLSYNLQQKMEYLGKCLNEKKNVTEKVGLLTFVEDEAWDKIRNKRLDSIIEYELSKQIDQVIYKVNFLAIDWDYSLGDNWKDFMKDEEEIREFTSKYEAYLENYMQREQAPSASDRKPLITRIMDSDTISNLFKGSEIRNYVYFVNLDQNFEILKDMEDVEEIIAAIKDMISEVEFFSWGEELEDVLDEYFEDYDDKITDIMRQEINEFMPQIIGDLFSARDEYLDTQGADHLIETKLGKYLYKKGLTSIIGDVDGLEDIIEEINEEMEEERNAEEEDEDITISKEDEEPIKDSTDTDEENRKDIEIVDTEDNKDGKEDNKGWDEYDSDSSSLPDILIDDCINFPTNNLTGEDVEAFSCICYTSVERGKYEPSEVNLSLSANLYSTYLNKSFNSLNYQCYYVALRELLSITNNSGLMFFNNTLSPIEAQCFLKCIADCFHFRHDIICAILASSIDKSISTIFGSDVNFCDVNFIKDDGTTLQLKSNRSPDMIIVGKGYCIIIEVSVTSSSAKSLLQKGNDLLDSKYGVEIQELISNNIEVKYYPVYFDTSRRNSNLIDTLKDLTLFCDHVNISSAEIMLTKFNEIIKDIRVVDNLGYLIFSKEDVLWNDNILATSEQVDIALDLQCKITNDFKLGVNQLTRKILINKELYSMIILKRDELIVTLYAKKYGNHSCMLVKKRRNVVIIDHPDGLDPKTIISALTYGMWRIIVRCSRLEIGKNQYVPANSYGAISVEDKNSTYTEFLPNVHEESRLVGTVDVSTIMQYKNVKFNDVYVSTLDEIDINFLLSIPNKKKFSTLIIDEKSGETASFALNTAMRQEDKNNTLGNNNYHAPKSILTLPILDCRTERCEDGKFDYVFNEVGSLNLAKRILGDKPKPVEIIPISKDDQSEINIRHRNYLTKLRDFLEDEENKGVIKPKFKNNMEKDRGDGSKRSIASAAFKDYADFKKSVYSKDYIKNKKIKGEKAYRFNISRADKESIKSEYNWINKKEVNINRHYNVSHYRESEVFIERLTKYLFETHCVDVSKDGTSRIFDTGLDTPEMTDLKNEMMRQSKQFYEKYLGSNIYLISKFISNLCHKLLFLSQDTAKGSTMTVSNMGYKGTILLVRGGKKIHQTGDSRQFRLQLPVPENVFEHHLVVYSKSYTFKKGDDGKFYMLTPWMVLHERVLNSMLFIVNKTLTTFVNYLGRISGELSGQPIHLQNIGYNFILMLNNRRSTEKLLTDIRYPIVNSMGILSDIDGFMSSLAQNCSDGLQRFTIERLIQNYSIFFSQMYNQKDYIGKMHVNLIHPITGKTIQCLTDLTFLIYCTFGMTKSPHKQQTEQSKNLIKVLGYQDDYTKLFDGKVIEDMSETLKVLNLDDNNLDKLYDSDFYFSGKYAVKMGEGFADIINSKGLVSNIHQKWNNIMNQNWITIENDSGLRGNELKTQGTEGFFGRKSHEVVMNELVKDLKEQLSNNNISLNELLNKTKESIDPMIKKVSYMSGYNISFHKKINSMSNTKIYFHIVDVIQWKGGREAYVMNLNTKIIQKPIEDFFKYLCMQVDNELISIPSNKRSQVVHSMLYENKHMSANQEHTYVKYNITFDASKWGPKSVFLKYLYFIKGFQHLLPKSFTDLFNLIQEEYLHKTMVISQAIEKMISTNKIYEQFDKYFTITDTGEIKRKYSASKNKAAREPHHNLPQLDEEVKILIRSFQMPYSFIMGIFNYLSSLFHALIQKTFIEAITPYINKRYSTEILMQLWAHSDDSGGYIMINKKVLSQHMAIIATIIDAYQNILKLSNITLSMKKCVISTQYFEMLSILYINDKLLPMVAKFFSNMEVKPGLKGYSEDMANGVSRCIELMSIGATFSEAYLGLRVLSENVRLLYHLKGEDRDRPTSAYGGLYAHPLMILLFGSKAENARLYFADDKKFIRWQKVIRFITGSDKEIWQQSGPQARPMRLSRRSINQLLGELKEMIPDWIDEDISRATDLTGNVSRVLSFVNNKSRDAEYMNSLSYSSVTRRMTNLFFLSSNMVYRTTVGDFIFKDLPVLTEVLYDPNVCEDISTNSREIRSIMDNFSSTNIDGYEKVFSNLFIEIKDIYDFLPKDLSSKIRITKVDPYRLITCKPVHLDVTLNREGFNVPTTPEKIFYSTHEDYFLFGETRIFKREREIVLRYLEDLGIENLDIESFNYYVRNFDKLTKKDFYMYAYVTHDNRELRNQVDLIRLLETNSIYGYTVDKIYSNLRSVLAYSTLPTLVQGKSWDELEILALYAYKHRYNIKKEINVEDEDIEKWVSNSDRTPFFKELLGDYRNKKGDMLRYYTSWTVPQRKSGDKWIGNGQLCLYVKGDFFMFQLERNRLIMVYGNKTFNEISVFSYELIHYILNYMKIETLNRISGNSNELVVYIDSKRNLRVDREYNSETCICRYMYNETMFNNLEGEKVNEHPGKWRIKGRVFKIHSLVHSVNTNFNNRLITKLPSELSLRIDIDSPTHDNIVTFCEDLEHSAIYPMLIKNKLSKDYHLVRELNALNSPNNTIYTPLDVLELEFIIQSKIDPSIIPESVLTSIVSLSGNEMILNNYSDFVYDLRDGMKRPDDLLSWSNFIRKWNINKENIEAALVSGSHVNLTILEKPEELVSKYPGEIMPLLESLEGAIISLLDQGLSECLLDDSLGPSRQVQLLRRDDILFIFYLLRMDSHIIIENLRNPPKLFANEVIVQIYDIIFNNQIFLDLWKKIISTHPILRTCVSGSKDSRLWYNFHISMTYYLSGHEYVKLDSNTFESVEYSLRKLKHNLLFTNSLRPSGCPLLSLSGFKSGVKLETRYKKKKIFVKLVDGVTGTSYLPSTDQYPRRFSRDLTKEEEKLLQSNRIDYISIATQQEKNDFIESTKLNTIIQSISKVSKCSWDISVDDLEFGKVHSQNKPFTLPSFSSFGGCTIAEYSAYNDYFILSTTHLPHDILLFPNEYIRVYNNFIWNKGKVINGLSYLIAFNLPNWFNLDKVCNLIEIDIRKLYLPLRVSMYLDPISKEFKQVESDRLDALFAQSKTDVGTIRKNLDSSIKHGPITLMYPDSFYMDQVKEKHCLHDCKKEAFIKENRDQRDCFLFAYPELINDYKDSLDEGNSFTDIEHVLKKLITNVIEAEHKVAVEYFIDKYKDITFNLTNLIFQILRGEDILGDKLENILSPDHITGYNSYSPLDQNSLLYKEMFSLFGDSTNLILNKGLSLSPAQQGVLLNSLNGFILLLKQNIGSRDDKQILKKAINFNQFITSLIYGCDSKKSDESYSALSNLIGKFQQDFTTKYTLTSNPLDNIEYFDDDEEYTE